jgi:hypothetical protein
MRALLIKLVLPATVFVLASAGAIVTNNKEAKNKSIQAEVQGFRRIAPFVCIPIRLCNNLGGPVCISGIDLMYSKASPTSDCTTLLTHKS